MAIVTTMPTITLPVSAEACDLYAAHSPIVYSFQRKDDEVYGTNNNGGILQIVTTSNYPTSLSIGDRIYVDGYGVVKVTNLVDPVTLDTDAIYSGSIFPLIINYIDTYADYYISVRVIKFDPYTLIYKQVSQVKIEPDNTGIALFDLSSIAKSCVSSGDSNNYDFISVNNELYQHAHLKVGVAEYTDIISPYVVVSEPYVLCAAMPIRNRFFSGTPPVWVNAGSNMAEYYPVTGGQDKCKFLSSVRKLRMWYSLPFNVGYYVQILMVPSGDSIKLCELVKDVNGTDVYGYPLSYTVGPINTPGGLERNQLQYYHTIATLAGGYGPYDPNARVSELTIMDEGETIAFSETLIIRHTSCLPKSPVYLRAWDTVGTWRYFCFGSGASYGMATRNGDTFERWVSNIAFKTDTGRLLTKSATPTIKVGAELLDEWDRQICEVILASPEVQMLANPLTWRLFDPSNSTFEGPDWRTVIVKDGNFQTKNTPTLSTVEMTIELPDIQLQTQ